MGNIDTARTQASGIAGALNGDSNYVQRFDVESDSNPTRLLAAASAHTYNSLQALIDEVAALRDEVDALHRRFRHR